MLPVKHYQFADVVASKNVMWIVNDWILGGDAKLIGQSFKEPPVTSTHVSDNIAYGTLYKEESTLAKWATAESAVIGSMEKLTVLDTDPLESVDLTKGTSRSSRPTLPTARNSRKNTKDIKK